MSLEGGSVAQSLGFQKGDVVLKVNDAPITTTADLQKVLAQPSRVWRITILRGDQQISVVLGG